MHVSIFLYSLLVDEEVDFIKKNYFFHILENMAIDNQVSLKARMCDFFSHT